jgi:[acyl-carrier-protein] S-malonyltransferase
MKKIALLFAGQGAQTVGMGRDLGDQFPVAANLFREADQILGRKLTDIMLNGSIEELTRTSKCQPALFVHGLACFSILRELAGDFPVAGAAGLSLGEITAHAAAGTFDFTSGLKLVQKRGHRINFLPHITHAVAIQIDGEEGCCQNKRTQHGGQENFRVAVHVEASSMHALQIPRSPEARAGWGRD